MPNLTDYIEEYLKKLLSLSTGSPVEIRRGELAKKFNCVPSQINYVLERRFSIDRGYLVESRRGGGGWIRIYRVQPADNVPWKEMVAAVLEEEIDPLRVRHRLNRLAEDKLLSQREARIFEAIIDDEHYISQELSEKKARALQKKILAAALGELLKERF